MNETDVLNDLVSINSVFPNEGKIGGYLEGSLKELGFETRRQYISAERFNVIGERGGRGAPVLFYGHMDTVPVYGNWVSDPFELTEKNGKLYGLGAYDMKAGIAALLCAFHQKTDRRIRVAFGVDEENNSAGAWNLVNGGLLDNVEGIVTSEIGDVSEENKQAIILGRRGRAVFEFRVPGKSMHGAHSNGQASAASEASKLAIALEKMNSSLPKHEHLPDASQFVSSIKCEATSLSTPEEAVVVLDRHLVVPENAETALKHLQEFLDSLYSSGELSEIDGKRASVRIKPRDYPYLMPYITAKDDEFAKKFSASVDGEPVYNYGWSVADESILASTGIPLVTLPPAGGNEHQADEWVSKNSYLQVIRTLKKFIQQS
jgi:acetylornithine deacetylase/succinyl-diaminopimelate desuccinylase-like protein